MKNFCFCFWVCLLLINQMTAQVNVDSLRRVAEEVGPDAADRTDALDALAFYYQERQPDSALFFADQLYAWGLARPDQRAQALALGHQGRYHAKKGAYARAEALYQQAMQSWKAQGNPGGISGVLGKLGLMHYLKGDYEQALIYFRRNLALSDSLGDQKEAAGMLLNIGGINLYQSNYEEALDYFARSLERFEAMRDLARQATILGNMGIVHNDRGDYTQALTYYRRSLAMHDSADNPIGMAQTLGNMGLIYNYQGDYRQALNHYQQSNELFEAVDDQLGLAINWGNIAMMYYAQQDYVQALVYNERALRTYEALENKRGIAKTLNHIGDVFSDQGDLDQSLAYYRRSITIHEALKDQNSIALLEKNIGDIYQRQGQAAEALAQYQRSLAIREAIKDQKGIADAATSLGEYYREAGDYAKARFYGEKALPLAQAAGAVKEIRNAAHLLYQTYKATGQAPQALAVHELYHHMRDSLNSAENQRATIRFEFQQQALADSLANEQEKALSQLSYENQLSQQRLQLGFAGGVGGLLAILAVVLYRTSRRRRRTNQLLSDQNEQIEAKSQQNELLLKEIHHRVKNNLQTVSSLLNLQSAGIEDATALAAMKESHNRVRAMSIIHQKLYQGEQLASVEMKDYFETMGQVMLQSFGPQAERIALNVDMPPIDLDVDTAIPIGLIVNELMTNSLKYAFPDQREGAIEISLHAGKEDTLTLRIADNGAGSSAAGQSEWHKASTGFGGRLVQLLVQQLGARMEQHEAGGYTTIIRFSNPAKAA